MKKFLLLSLILNLLVPLYAQGEFSPVVKLIHNAKLLPRPGVPFASYQANMNFYRQLAKEPRIISFLPTDLKQGHSVSPVFQIQHTDSPFAKASSAFAIDLFNNGEVWGVAAGHVGRNITHSHHKIARKPHMRVQTGPNSFIIAPLEKEKFYIGNPNGMDIVLFKIPKEVLPYITVLHPTEQHAPSLGQEVTIYGFLEQPAQPFTLYRQKVLFSSPLRIVLEKTPDIDLRGACGSPGLTNGYVSMVHIGSDSVGTLIWYDWFNKLPEEIKRSMSNMHYAIPIDVVKMMAKTIEETGSLNEGGMMMKVLGHPVALLHPNQSIMSVEQFRNGKSVTKINNFRHFSLNPEQLELFFELQENDILRISLDEFSLQQAFPSSPSVVYDVNVSTGQVTKIPVP